MATAHTFLATDEDLPLILDWLKNAGAVPVANGLDVTDFGATGHKIALYFPAIGSLHFWKNPIAVDEFPENSAEWLNALLTKIKQEEEPERKRVDPNKTPSAGLHLPELREDRYWVSGELWFPTINLRKKFPDLGKICGRFERWIRKYPCVFDNRKGKFDGPFVDQIAQASIVKCINALPSAFELLRNGHHMLDYMVNDKSFERWKDQWKSEEDANSSTKPSLAKP
jgi:hypothetical protein